MPDGRRVSAFHHAVPFGSAEFGGPFSIWELKVVQEVISLTVFAIFALVFMKSDSLRWNHIAGFLCLILAVYFIFRK